MSAPAPLLIRTDAGARIGTGHVMRCLALSGAWGHAGAAAHFLLADPSPAITRRIAASGVAVHRVNAAPGSARDAECAAELARELGARWVVVDGYHFGADFVRALAHAGLRVFFIDDYGHATHYTADLVLNQNLSADASLYASRGDHTRLLLGPRFALLRPEFLRLRERASAREVPAQARELLVSFGGSDPDNVTELAVRALAELDWPDLRVTVIVGGSNPHRSRLLALAGERVAIAIDVDDMPERIAHADLALAAAGTTAWEFALLGLPALLVTISDNQAENAIRIDQAGFARSLGWYNQLDPGRVAAQVRSLAADADRRRRMADRGRELVDGLGAWRVWLRMNEERLSFRAATRSDAELLHRWANRPDVRAVSFTPESIPWDTHVEWLERKLADRAATLWIAGLAGADIGPVRFEEAQEGAATISVMLSDEYRGRSLGSLLIHAACERYFEATACQCVLAYVKPDNEASRRAFEKAEFRYDGPGEVLGSPALIYRLDRACPGVVAATGRRRGKS